MKKQLIGYWLATALFCLAMTAGGMMNLMRADMQKEAMTALGYPDYLMTILGVAKMLGVIALLIPGVPLLKEWAYAGFTFDLLGTLDLSVVLGSCGFSSSTGAPGVRGSCAHATAESGSGNPKLREQRTTTCPITPGIGFMRYSCPKIRFTTLLGKLQSNSRSPS